MKKISILFFIVLFTISCAPKRAKCYGKRCVETSTKKEAFSKIQKNS